MELKQRIAREVVCLIILAGAVIANKLYHIYAEHQKAVLYSNFTHKFNESIENKGTAAEQNELTKAQQKVEKNYDEKKKTGDWVIYGLVCFFIVRYIVMLVRTGWLKNDDGN